ncbi:hypothetical protein HNP98_002765 [Hymenobacter sp. 9A]|uniref:Uncharacterized protein n=1 Tax=Hymenobacter caeli TaxID=2735894 RepID=A0ABX2FTY4_9BACT|nr:hypothetical protein [Hymenobacter caeli]
MVWAIDTLVMPTVNKAARKILEVFMVIELWLEMEWKWFKMGPFFHGRLLYAKLKARVINFLIIVVLNIISSTLTISILQNLIAINKPLAKN